MKTLFSNTEYKKAEVSFSGSGFTVTVMALVQTTAGIVEDIVDFRCGFSDEDRAEKWASHELGLI